MRNGGYCVFVDSLGCGGVVRNRKGPCHFFEVLGIPLSQRTFLGKGGARATNDNDVGSMLIRNRLFLPCYGGLEQPQCKGVRTSSSRFLSG